MDLDNEQKSDALTAKGLNSPNEREKLSKTWERPGTHQDPSFINKRIDHARQPFTIFDIIRDQQQSLTGANLTTAFVKLAELTNVDDTKHALKSHKIFTEMMLTAAQNSKLFSDEDLSKIIWALAQLDAEPPVEVMDSFMCNLYSRMEKVETQALSIAFWGLARLDYVPGEKVLIRSCQTLAERLRMKEGRLSSFSRCLWSLAVMGYCPFDGILDDFIALGSTCLGSLTPLEVGQLLWSLIQFGYHPGNTFLSIIDALFCGEECMWSAEDISLLFWGMATYSYNLNQMFIIRSIDLVHHSLPEAGWSVLVRTLNACARLCFHPGEDFLHSAAAFLTNQIGDVYYEAIETILWSYATFSFHPGCDLLDKLTSKIDGQISLFSTLHLANILWCYALFDVCSTHLWRGIIEVLESQQIEEIPPEALYRVFQVYLLKNNNAPQPSDQEENKEFELTVKLREAGLALWTKELSRRQETISEFHQEVFRVLSSLYPQQDLCQNYIPNQTLCLSFYMESLKKGIDLIEEHEFTVNTTQPIGSAIMRTKLTRAVLLNFPGNKNVHFLKYTYWSGLLTETEKQQCLNSLLSS